jgi:hypothetical protein
MKSTSTNATAMVSNDTVCSDKVSYFTLYLLSDRSSIRGPQGHYKINEARLLVILHVPALFSDQGNVIITSEEWVSQASALDAEEGSALDDEEGSAPGQHSMTKRGQHHLSHRRTRTKTVTILLPLLHAFRARSVHRLKYFHI